MLNFTTTDNVEIVESALLLNVRNAGIVAHWGRSLTLLSSGTDMEQMLKHWEMVHGSVDAPM